MVHRWAAANLRGDIDHRTEDSEAEAAAEPDLIGWYTDGLAALLETLRSASDAVDAMVFLEDAPPPRQFWARRQLHETTIHSADALAARLGRPPRAAATAITPELAADGIDELLCGFVPRRSGRLRSAEPFTLLVTVTDVDAAWALDVSEDPVVTTVVDTKTDTDADTETTRNARADAVLSGTEVQVYLGMWNRGDEVRSEGRADVLEQWRSQVRIRWASPRVRRPAYRPTLGSVSG
jgi:hypothetical protein